MSGLRVWGWCLMFSCAALIAYGFVKGDLWKIWGATVFMTLAAVIMTNTEK